MNIGIFFLIREGMNIRKNSELETVDLPNLKSVYRHFTFKENKHLSYLGVKNIKTIEGNINITGNAKLCYVDQAAHFFETTKSTGYKMTIRANAKKNYCGK